MISSMDLHAKIQIHNIIIENFARYKYINLLNYAMHKTAVS